MQLSVIQFVYICIYTCLYIKIIVALCPGQSQRVHGNADGRATWRWSLPRAFLMCVCLCVSICVYRQCTYLHIQIQQPITPHQQAIHLSGVSTQTNRTYPQCNNCSTRHHFKYSYKIRRLLPLMPCNVYKDIFYCSTSVVEHWGERKRIITNLVKEISICPPRFFTGHGWVDWWVCPGLCFRTCIDILIGSNYASS
jgi:hypothetical protein